MHIVKILYKFKLRLITDEDKYAVKVFGEEDKFLFSIGIGNPLYATYEHIGYVLVCYV